MNNFVRDALTGQNIVLYGDGSTRRSYLYGSDAAAWLLGIMLNGEDGEVYNVGGLRPYSHREVAEMVASKCTENPKIVYKYQRDLTGRSYDFLPDLTKTQAKLGLSQVVELEDAINRVMNWYPREI